MNASKTRLGGRPFWVVALFSPLLLVAGLATTSGAASPATGTQVSGIAVVTTSPAPPIQSVYIADTAHNRVVKVDPTGVQTVVLDTGLNWPAGVAADTAGDVFIADAHNNRVIKVTPGGTQSLVGTGLAVPYGVAVDRFGNAYIADTVNARIVEVTAGGVQSTVLGVGLSAPHGVAVDPAGDVFIADKGNNRVVEVTPTGTQRLIGTGLSLPWGVAVDATGDVFIADKGNDRVEEVTPAGVQSTIASGLGDPTSVDVDARGDVLVADPGHASAVEILPGGTKVTLGTGLAVPLGASFGTGGSTAAAAGSPVTLSAGLFPAGPGAPSGTVTFSSGGLVLGTSPINRTSTGASVASLTTKLKIGVDTVVATYGGDAQYAGATNTVEVDEVGTAPTISGTPPSGSINQSYSFTFELTGAPEPRTFLSRGTLPAGLTLSKHGVISGVPQGPAGTFHFTVQAANGVVPAAYEKIALVIS